MSAALLLDAGNSRLKWRVHAHGQTLAEGVDSYPLTDPAPWAAMQLKQVLACNVAGAEVAAAIEASVNGLQVNWLRSVHQLAGITNHYRDPAQLGTDRFAAMIGARSHVADQPLIVVMAGTAMTVDALTAEGDFLGGVIVPGLRLMRAALQQGTANLGLPAGEVADFPASTGDAILTGAHIALAGVVSLMVERLQSHVGQPPLVLLSGGDGAALLPGLAGARHIDNLVLDGLARLAEQCVLQELKTGDA